MRKPKQLFWMEMAQLYATRATCKRRKCSALFVRDNRLVVAGYNGATSGQPHCTEVGCLMIDGHCLRCLHAEYSAICYAACEGIEIANCDVYISGGTPCIRCAHGLIAVGAQNIYVDSFYPDEAAIKLLHDCDVKLIGILSDEEYSNYLNGPKMLDQFYVIDGERLLVLPGSGYKSE